MPDAYSVLNARAMYLMGINGVVGTGVGQGNTILVYCVSEETARSVPRSLDGVQVIPVVTSQPQALY